MPEPRVVIAVLPERGGVPDYEILNRFIEIARRGYPFFPCHYMRVDKQRNLLATRLLESDYTHLLMLDADHLHPVDVVEQLVAVVKQDPHRLVVSGLSFRRGPPFDPVAWYKVDGQVRPMLEWGQGLITPDLVGSACLLINREVFERLERPYFAFTYNDAVHDKYGGEDIYFCNKCGAAGIGIWVNTMCVSPHLGKTWITEATFRQYLHEAGISTDDSDEQ